MTTLETTATTVWRGEEELPLDEAHLAAAAFLARYSGRTLDAYRHDLRAYFQWAADNHLRVLAATRPHIELYRAPMETCGLAPSTIDRRLSTVCGFYRFAHIDGRLASNPAQYVRRPKVQPSEGHGMDRAELGTFLFTAERFDREHAALAVLLGLNGLRVSAACATNVEDLAVQRGHRTLRILGKGNKPATIPLLPRTARTIDPAVGERHEGPILRRKDGQRLDRRTAHRWIRSIGKRAGLGLVHPHMLRAGFIMAALDAGVPLRDVQIAARHADPSTTTIYDRRRENFDRHAAYSSSPSSPAVDSSHSSSGTSGMQDVAGGGAFDESPRCQEPGCATFRLRSLGSPARTTSQHLSLALSIAGRPYFAMWHSIRLGSMQCSLRSRIRRAVVFSASWGGARRAWVTWRGRRR